MFGFVEWIDRRARGNAIREKKILNLRFCGTSVLKGPRTPRFLLRRRLSEAAKRLHRAGVTRAVFPENFQDWEIFARNGILPIDGLPLCRALAPELVRSVMEQRRLSSQTAVLAVCGNHISSELERTVTELCIRNRYVLLSAPDWNGTLCRRLRREYGVSLVLTDEVSRLAKADIIVLFDPKEGLRSDAAITLSLYHGAPLPQVNLSLTGSGEEETSSLQCNQIQFWSALFEAGAIRSGQLSAVVRIPEVSADA
jgi:hypothetical protein